MILYKYTNPFAPIHVHGVDVDVDVDNKTITYTNCRCGSNKKFTAYSYKCSDEEWTIFEKYGLDAWRTWRILTTKEQDDFKKYIQLYQSYWELYYEYYEDLCLYAIMYRNLIRLSPAIADVMSVRFFVSKADVIKGFKEWLKKSDICKYEVAKLYFNNRTIFSNVFAKYLSYDILHDSFIPIFEMRPITRNNVVVDFNNDIFNGVGINNLTIHDCSEILKHKDGLFDVYKNAYKNTIENNVIKENGISYSKKFFISKFIPYYGRINTKTASSYDRVCNAEITPVLNNDSKDKILSEHEFLCADRWFRCVEQIRAEEEERQIKQNLEEEKIRAEQKRKEEEVRRAKIEYNKRNKHSRDSYISFDEAAHLYKVEGEIFQSVTNFVEGCFPKFDSEFYAKKKATYLGITEQEVLDMWEQKGKESRKLGTELHKKIENYYKDIASAEDDTFKLFLMFAKKIELKPYRTEWIVYDKIHKIAGTIDFVDFQNGEYIIYDWKRSDKIIDNGLPIKISKYEEKGKFPIDHLDNTPYYHYALQLSIYKYILENNYNIEISDLRLGIFHPTYNKPYVLRIPYLEKEINKLFELRSEVLF